MRRRSSLLWAFLVLGCSDRANLLSSPAFDASDGPSAGGTSGNGGSGGTAGDGGSGGTAGDGGSGGTGALDAGMDTAGAGWRICGEALRAGQDGDRCSFADDCSERERCAFVQATCRGGALLLARQSDPSCQRQCFHDRECDFGLEWCEGGFCVACAPERVGPCEHGWTEALFPRNGCSFVACAPRSECYRSDQCPPDTVCYAGQTCAPDCVGRDPSCCEGNFCSRPGCDVGQARISCEHIGCPLGTRCPGGQYERGGCVCTGVGWDCAQPAEFHVCQ